MSFKNNTFKPADACQNSTIAFYQRQISNQQKVLARVKAVLPIQLAEKIAYCVVSKKKLILYVESSEWALQLSFCQQRILQSVSDLVTLEEVQMRVVCDVIKANNDKVKPITKRPSAQTIHDMHQNAQLGEDDELKQSLLRLSQTLNRLS